MEIKQRSPVTISVHPRWSDAPEDGRTSLAMAAGLVAALVAGLIWAGIVLVTNYEIGWVAWGVGLLVGGAMARVTVERSRGLGMTAAGLACAGLLVGKLAVTLGSTGGIAEELMQNPEYLQGAVAWQMYDADELDAETSGSVAATLAVGDTLSDAIWADMLLQADGKLAGMTDEEKRLVAGASAEAFVGGLGMVGAVLVQLGPWDLLWFGLALATAYRMMAQHPAEEDAAAPA
jgi:hypothetical protein